MSTWITRLRLERTNRGLTQTKLAAEADLSASDISKFENGWARPYPSQAQRLARALGIPTSEAESLGEEVEPDGRAVA